MEKAASSFLLRWGNLFLVIFSLAIGIGMVVAMYSQGGMSATFPFNFIGLAGYLLIGYVIINGGIVDLGGKESYELLSQMIARARKNIWIFSGSIDSRVYLNKSAEGERIIDLLLHKAMQGVMVDVITEQKPDSETLSALFGRAPQNLRVFQNSSLVGVSEHFTIVDGSWARVESEHAEGEIPRRTRGVKHSLHLADCLKRDFTFLLSEAQGVALS